MSTLLHSRFSEFSSQALDLQKEDDSAKNGLLKEQPTTK